MRNSKTKQESLHGQTNVNEANKQNSFKRKIDGLTGKDITDDFHTGKEIEEEIEKEQLIEREKVEGTPFWIIGDKEKGYFLIMGKHKLTENLQSPTVVRKYLDDNAYDIIFKMVLGLITDIKADELAAKREWTKKNTEIETDVQQD